jgi:hypothetical protein
MMPEQQTIPIDQISTDDTQTRASLNATIIKEYAEAYKEGIELPPIDVYFDGLVYWLSDGFHRLKAVEFLRRDAITANVHLGGRRDAILHAVGANEDHGLRRTNADRRTAVRILLTDPEWSTWANTEVARQCNVSEYLVRTIRSELMPAEGEPVKEKTRKVRRGTTTYPMKTERIGAKTSQKTSDLPEPDTAEEHIRPLAPVSSIQSKINNGITAPAEPETAVDQEPAVSPDIPPELPPSAERKPIELTPDTVAAGRMTLEPEATTIPEELLQQVTLAIRWDYATRVEQEVFVAEHREELQKILEKLGKNLDRQNAVSS